MTEKKVFWISYHPPFFFFFFCNQKNKNKKNSLTLSAPALKLAKYKSFF